MKLLLYCCKAKPYLLDMPKDNEEFEKGIQFSLTDGKEFYQACLDVNNYKLNGKIVAECDFEVEEIEHYIHYEPEVDVGIAILPSFECEAYHTNTTGHFELLKQSCLTEDELFSYLNGNNGYAIHIKNLHIFDKPKKITAYHCKLNKNDDQFMNGGCGYKFFFKAPQNMMKVYDHWGEGNDYILISIKPEWLCKILNGEKTIEVRKKVLKEMLK